MTVHGNGSTARVRGRSRPEPVGMRYLDGGTFVMGSEQFYPEERPLRQVRVDPFWIDVKPVTNADFRAFVEETGYITLAEIAPDPNDYPGMKPELAQPGSRVFAKTAGPVDLNNVSHWWQFRLGADWRHPLGPGSSTEGIENHPVVHVAWKDAQAYARWAGKSLPTEAEWELAARGGLIDAEYAWGDELAPGGKPLANYWQGAFPHENTLDDGWERTSPVGFYPPNAYGLHDMIGNVWEWTRDWWSVASQASEGPKRACCIPLNPRGGTLRESFDKSGVRIGRRVLKGGSHLCAENYCQRYRPAARHAQMIDSSTSHIGFRCVMRP